MQQKVKKLSLRRIYRSDKENCNCLRRLRRQGNLYCVEDDGHVTGITNCDDVMLRVNNAIRDAVRQDVTLFTEFNVEKINDEPVVVITVQRGTARPYYLAGNGIRLRAFLCVK